MAVHAQVEAAETISRQAVATALQHNSFRAIVSHDGLNDRLEDAAIGVVGNAIAQREIDSVVFARAHANVSKLTGTGEILAVLVKRHSHDTVCRVEGFFDAVSMMHIDIDVQNALLVP